jgi:hypothetical protein
MAALREDIKRLEKLFLKKLPLIPVSAATTSHNSNSSNSLASHGNRPTDGSVPTTSAAAALNQSTGQHVNFRLISASVDELVCELVDLDRRRYRINANICETYPLAPPVWFSESEDPLLSDIVEKLSSTVDDDNKVSIVFFSFAQKNKFM